MALTQQRKQEIMSNYQVHETDTGSAEVQVAMLSDRISRLPILIKAVGRNIKL
jgi:small subunit ribosomal protein S15